MSLILCHMTKVINVSMICFKLIFFKKTLKERELKEINELNKSDNNDADEQKRNIWEKKEW